MGRVLTPNVGGAVDLPPPTCAHHRQSTAGCGSIRRVSESFGLYTLHRQLAETRHCEVWLADAESLTGPPVTFVIKRSKPECRGDASVVEGLLDEARLVQRLAHPNIVQVRDAGFHEGDVFLAFEHVEGLTLGDLLLGRHPRVPPIPVGAALRITTLVLDALHFAHQLLGEDGLPLNLVHRDVSPTNIMVTPKGGVKLLDFGIARSTERISGTAAGFTRGKVGFMSPEQAQGGALDARTDIFATGLNLYWLLCGQSPFPERETDFESLRDAAQGNLTPPQVLWPQIPWPLASIINTALALQPGNRFPTALAMRQQVVGYAAQERISLAAPELAKVVEEVWRRQNLVFIPPSIAPVKPGSRT